MRVKNLGRAVFFFVPLMLASQSAPAATATGPNALALAALVGLVSPQLTSREKRVMTRLFGGSARIRFAPSRQFSVKADKVACRVNNVDITKRSCKLTFGSTTVDAAGRDAHALFATIALVGVPPDAAAGSVFETLSKLVCNIDLNLIAQRAGGGVDCMFESGGR